MATAEEKFDNWFSETRNDDVFDCLNGDTQDNVILDFTDSFDFKAVMQDNMEDSKLDAEGFGKAVLEGWDSWLREADLDYIRNDHLATPFTDDDDKELAADEREGEDDGPAEPEQP